MRLATDVGGTFTDLIAYDETTGRVTFAKSLTTVDDQSRGVLDAVHLAQGAGMDIAKVSFFVHGGTTVINAITERKGVKTALVTTSGFRDVLEIARGNRPDLYNLRSRTPEPFVPRYLRFEVRERMLASGEVHTPLNEDDVRQIARHCREEGVESVGIVFLHSYANPEHEAHCAEILRAELPGLSISASFEISRQWREYERTNTVALNAYVQPIIQKYFTNLGRALQGAGMDCAYYAMQSNGGIATFDQVTRAPLALVESGPSGGVAGAAHIGRSVGETDVLYLDVGGTTAKCSLIKNSEPKIDAEYHLEKDRLSPGYTVQVPVVDIVEVGAGGGSIAWLDETKRLRVGPRSAGSTPGPACYGRGGTEPTVTDAKLVLGVIDPRTFAEGRMSLDLEAAQTAIETIAKPLGLSIEEGAAATVAVAEEAMINALKLITIQRGHDPRDLALIVSGGAGPLLAASLGRELKTKTTIIPVHPGIFSAWGMLAARPRSDLRQTVFKIADDEALRSVDDTFSNMEETIVQYFGASRDSVRFWYNLEMRYKGQEHSVSVRYDKAESLDNVLTRFHDVHETTFSFSLRTSVIEITTLHLQSEQTANVIKVAEIMSQQTTLPAEPRSRRRLFLGEDQGWVSCPIYDREALPIDWPIQGPALIEEATTTTLVLGKQTCVRHRSGQLLIEERKPA
jgi:N-methylhydantoinase A